MTAVVPPIQLCCFRKNTSLSLYKKYGGDEGVKPTRARTHDAGDEKFGDADAQAERAAKRQRHAETRRAQRMLRHNSEAWLSEAQAERAAARNGPEDQKASSSSAAASSVPEQATAMQPPKPKKRKKKPRSAKRKASNSARNATRFG